LPSVVRRFQVPVVSGECVGLLAVAEGRHRRFTRPGRPRHVQRFDHAL